MTSSRVSGRPAKILLGEDESADVWLTIGTLWEKKISNYLHASRHGKEALSLLRCEDRYSGTPRPNLLLLDRDLLGEAWARDIRLDES